VAATDKEGHTIYYKVGPNMISAEALGNLYSMIMLAGPRKGGFAGTVMVKEQSAIFMGLEIIDARYAEAKASIWYDIMVYFAMLCPSSFESYAGEK